MGRVASGGVGFGNWQCTISVYLQKRKKSLQALVFTPDMLNMSLRRISPRLMARCNGNNSGTAVALSSRSTKTPCVPHVSRRAFSTPYKADSKSTAEEMEAALEKANESMKAYYSYPPEKIIAAKKLRFKQRLSDRQFYLQLGLSESSR